LGNGVPGHCPGYGATYKLASFLPDISSYPFSLGWSEGSRYYYASLWLSRQVYGVSVPPSVLHPTRYLLQAFPFLIPGASLWLNRFWQVALWVVTTGLTSRVLVRRLALTGRTKPLVISLCMILWGFIFLFQGPVYYHLQIIVIVILLGFDRHHFWRSLILVSIASLWAGLSRVNWLPVPGLLAAIYPPTTPWFGPAHLRLRCGTAVPNPTYPGYFATPSLYPCPLLASLLSA
jgi:hypothetical protein